MQKITQEFKEELIVLQLSDLASDSSTQHDVARYGFKGILMMNEEELHALARNFNVTPRYESV